MFIDPERSHAGLYAVDWEKNFIAWYAWREWLTVAFRKRFFPQILTISLPWPPSTVTGAELVARNISQWRKEVLDEDGRKAVRVTRGGGWRSFPDSPMPWIEWSVDGRTKLSDLEANRRQHEGSSFDRAPRYPIFARNFRWHPEPQKSNTATA